MRTWNKVYMRAFGTECICVHLERSVNAYLQRSVYTISKQNAKDQNNVSSSLVQINVNIPNIPHYHIPNESFEGQSLNSQTFRGKKNYRIFFLLTISIPDQCITIWTVLFFMSLTHSKANALQKCDNNVSNYFSHSLCCVQSALHAAGIQVEKEKKIVHRYMKTNEFWSLYFCLSKLLSIR